MLAGGCARGTAGEAGGEPLDARERELRKVARERPADPEAHRAVALHLLRARRPYEAMWAFQDVLERQPGDADARRGLARALILAQLPGRALEVLAASAKREGSALEARRVAAAAYLARGDAEGAVTMLEAVGPALDTSAAGLLDLAHSYEALGDAEAAARAYERHLRRDPQSLEGHLGMARSALRGRRWAAAFAAIEKARRIAPNDPRPLYRAALTLQARDGARAERSETGEAIALYRRILAAHPTYAPAHRQLGLWHLRQGRPDAAIPHLERALGGRGAEEESRLHLADAMEMAGRKGDAAYQRGLYYERTGRPHLAAAEYRRLAALDPKRPDVSLLLSAAYSQMEKDTEAAEVARQGWERHPGDLRARTRYAMLLMMTDDRAQAAALCEQWTREQPEWAEPYRLLARLEREALQPAEAIRSMEQALKREPRNHEYHLEMARSLIALGTSESLRRAARTLREGLALAPQDPEIPLRLAEVLERLGDLEGARLYYLRSMDRARSVHFGAYSLSQLCPRLKKPERARFYAENVRAIREREDASVALLRQLHRDPEDTDARARLAAVLLEAADSRQALYHLELVARDRPGSEESRRLQVLRRLHSMREE